MKKKKQTPIIRSKEQILADLRANVKFQEKMTFIKEKVYPALCDATTSIDDATQNLSIINTVIMEKFLGFMKEKTMKDINIYSNLDPKDPKYEELKALLQLFDEYSVFDTKDILEGMKNEITLFITEENKSRQLSDLKTKWLDEL